MKVCGPEISFSQLFKITDLVTLIVICLFRLFIAYCLSFSRLCFSIICSFSFTLSNLSCVVVHKTRLFFYWYLQYLHDTPFYFSNRPCAASLLSLQVVLAVCQFYWPFFKEPVLSIDFLYWLYVSVWIYFCSYFCFLSFTLIFLN